jgi:hypothetical protein
VANLPVPTVPATPLPTTPEAICARLLSGDANADGTPDDLNHNGVPDLQELVGAIYGTGGSSSAPSGSVVGLPNVTGGN